MNNKAKSLTAIIAAINYDDFLDITLFENRGIFDRNIVITDSKDIKTQELCKKHKVTCLVTDVFYINNNINKILHIIKNNIFSNCTIFVLIKIVNNNIDNLIISDI